MDNNLRNDERKIAEGSYFPVPLIIAAIIYVIFAIIDFAFLSKALDKMSPVIIPEIIVFGVIVLGLVWFCTKSSIVVTDKRVFGVASFGKRIDLPLNAISSVAKTKFGLSVATSSGSIRFKYIKDGKEVYEAITNIILDKQSADNTAPTVQTNVIQTDEADMISKYKKLLDDGTITQEEFDAKKKELLGL